MPPDPDPNNDLDWQNDHTPLSRLHGDIYFSPEDGLQESRHVFLHGIHAPEIWQDKDHFTLLENGFGTGLNFIMTSHEWLKTAPPDARMTYIATEKFPLAKADIHRALSAWPELDPERENLLAKYPVHVPGFHQRDLAGGRIKLMLLFGDSADCLRQLEATVDAIYLDGFAPSRNPDMWSEEIFAQAARLAAPDARLATFTAAGFVRRGLEAAGFQMQKAAGFGKKREILHGRYTGPQATCPKPWFQRPVPLPSGRSIAVIGGGIAGLTTGVALQNAGYRVTIFERDSKPMNQASGNPAGILDPYLSLGNGADATFYRAALFHALDFFQSLDPGILLIRGLTKFPVDPSEKQKFSRLLEQKILPADFMCEAPDGGLHFPECGAISPPRIREVLSRRLTIRSGINITRIQRDRQWTLYEQETACDQADAVVICGGPGAIHFQETHSLPLDPVRGQITLLDAEKHTSPPKEVLCGKGYVIPPLKLNGRMTIVTGASFDRHNTDLTLRPEDHAENLNNTGLLWPGISELAVTGGRCALRAYSPDHLPVCGPVPDFAQYQDAYALLKHGPRHKNFRAAPCQPDLYVVGGLGARGFLSAPLLGDVITALITGAPLPVPEALYHSLHPARFLIRELSKAK